MLQFIRNILVPVAAPQHPHRQFVNHHHAGGPGPKLYGTDRIGLVGFNTKGFVIARPARPHDAWLQPRIMDLPNKVGGGTNIADGLRKALEIFDNAPQEIQGRILKRIWLYSDGLPTTEQDAILPLAEKAARQFINVNTVGFGNTGAFNEQLLQAIASKTHNGRFIRVHDLQELCNALVASGPNSARIQHRRHRMEFTVVVCDCSGSMSEDMGGRRKIEVAAQSLLHLVMWKQRLYA